MTVADNSEVISGHFVNTASRSIMTEHRDIQSCSSSEPQSYTLPLDSPSVYVEVPTPTKRKTRNQQRVVWLDGKKNTLPYITNAEMEERLANHSTRPRGLRNKEVR